MTVRFKENLRLKDEASPLYKVAHNKSKLQNSKKSKTNILQ
jgi:hypothetical protein